MNRSIKRAVATLSVAGALAIPAGAASAQPIFTGGLVNVTVVDVLNDNEVTVQVPINVAANICGVAVNVLAVDLADGPVECEAGNRSFTISR